MIKIIIGIILIVIQWVFFLFSDFFSAQPIFWKIVGILSGILISYLELKFFSEL